MFFLDTSLGFVLSLRKKCDSGHSSSMANSMVKSYGQLCVIALSSAAAPDNSLLARSFLALVKEFLIKEIVE